MWAVCVCVPLLLLCSILLCPLLVFEFIHHPGLCVPFIQYKQITYNIYALRSLCLCSLIACECEYMTIYVCLVSMSLSEYKSFLLNVQIFLLSFRPLSVSLFTIFFYYHYFFLLLVQESDIIFTITATVATALHCCWWCYICYYYIWIVHDVFFFSSIFLLALLHWQCSLTLSLFFSIIKFVLYNSLYEWDNQFIYSISLLHLECESDESTYTKHNI